METCADCGKPIGMNEESYYLLGPTDDIGKTFHTKCGDPFGVKAKDAEIDRLRALAKRLSDALLKVRPLGGSEMFIRLGEQCYADPDYCGWLIEEQNAALHEARKEAVRASANISR